MLILLRKFSCELLGLWQALTHSHQKTLDFLDCSNQPFSGGHFREKTGSLTLPKAKTWNRP